jgi:hypothetical protein
MRAVAEGIRATDRTVLEFLGLRQTSLASALLTGLVVGLAVVVAAISYPSLIFAGDLAPHAPLGLRIGLLSALVFSAVLALTSSYPGAVGVGQSEPAVVLAVSITASLVMSET